MMMDRTAYANRWTHMHPDTKIICSMGLLLACIASRNAWGSMASMGMAMGLCCAVARVPAGRFLGFLVAPLLFLGPALLGILLSSADEGRMLWQFQVASLRMGITREAADRAAVLGPRALGSVCSLLLLAFTTPMVDILGRLRALRVPGMLVDMMALVYRLIFVLLEQGENMLRAQNLRFGYRTPALVFRSAGIALGAMFHRVFHRATHMAMAVECRLGTGGLPVMEREYPAKNLKEMLLMTAGLIPLLIGRL